MTTFTNAVRKSTNYTRTENAAVALNSTTSALLDLFATAGALRTKQAPEIAQMFRKAFAEDNLLATKLMFYTRNIRGGLGERATFRAMLSTLATEHPEIVIKNIELIPLFGRWDDLYVLENTPVEDRMWELIQTTVMQDLRNMMDNKPISLCAKWLKSVNTSSPESRRLGKKTAKALHVSEKKYRQALSLMRSYINLLETRMSTQEWDKIEYSAVPSKAMKNYRKAFSKHDADRFSEFLGAVASGKEEIKATTLYPYDILKAAQLTYEYNWHNNGKFSITADPVLEAQWKALPNYVKGENNILVMADTSGSMESDNGLPMATSIGLAVYFAERNKGAYKNLFMTFSEHPEFVSLEGDTLKEKVGCISSIVANTNLEAAFDLILDVAVSNNVSQEEMPMALVIISDMHFDQATNQRSSFDTFHESMKRKFAARGYQMPTIIYWNVSQRGNAFQVTSRAEGVVLISGQSTSGFRYLISNIGRTPYDFMLEVLNDPMYEHVRI